MTPNPKRLAEGDPAHSMTMQSASKTPRHMLQGSSGSQNPTPSTSAKSQLSKTVQSSSGASIRRGPRKIESRTTHTASKTPVKQRKKSPSAGQPSQEKPVPKLKELMKERLGREDGKEE